jgi:hypothetical protein
MVRPCSRPAPDLPGIEWPEPDDGDEDENPFYDSTRSYLDQLDAYRNYQDKPGLVCRRHA